MAEPQSTTEPAKPAPPAPLRTEPEVTYKEGRISPTDALARVKEQEEAAKKRYTEDELKALTAQESRDTSNDKTFTPMLYGSDGSSRPDPNPPAPRWFSGKRPPVYSRAPEWPVPAPYQPSPPTGEPASTTGVVVQPGEPVTNELKKVPSPVAARRGMPLPGRTFRGAANDDVDFDRWWAGEPSIDPIRPRPGGRPSLGAQIPADESPTIQLNLPHAPEPAPATEAATYKPNSVAKLLSMPESEFLQVLSDEYTQNDPERLRFVQDGQYLRAILAGALPMTKFSGGTEELQAVIEAYRQLDDPEKDKKIEVLTGHLRQMENPEPAPTVPKTTEDDTTDPFSLSPVPIPPRESETEEPSTDTGEPPEVNLENPKASARELIKYITRRPHAADARMDMADLSFAIRSPITAKAWLEGLTEENFPEATDKPELARAQSLLGVIAVSEGNFAEATQYFKNAVALNPDDNTAYSFTELTLFELVKQLNTTYPTMSGAEADFIKKRAQLAISYQQSLTKPPVVAPPAAPPVSEPLPTIPPAPVLPVAEVGSTIEPPADQQSEPAPVLAPAPVTDTPRLETLPSDVSAQVEDAAPTETSSPSVKFTPEELQAAMEAIVPLTNEATSQLIKDIEGKTDDEIDEILADYAAATIHVDTKDKVTQILNNETRQIAPSRRKALSDNIRNLFEASKIENPDFYLTFYNRDDGSLGLYTRVRPKKETTPEPQAEESSEDDQVLKFTDADKDLL